jgi:hypothetical protein
MLWSARVFETEKNRTSPRRILNCGFYLSTPNQVFYFLATPGRRKRLNYTSSLGHDAVQHFPSFILPPLWDAAIPAESKRFFSNNHNNSEPFFVGESEAGRNIAWQHAISGRHV